MHRTLANRKKPTSLTHSLQTPHWVGHWMPSLENWEWWVKDLWWYQLSPHMSGQCPNSCTHTCGSQIHINTQLTWAWRTPSSTLYIYSKTYTIKIPAWSSLHGFYNITYTVSTTCSSLDELYIPLQMKPDVTVWTGSICLARWSWVESLFEDLWDVSSSIFQWTHACLYLLFCFCIFRWQWR